MSCQNRIAALKQNSREYPTVTDPGLIIFFCCRLRDVSDAKRVNSINLPVFFFQYDWMLKTGEQSSIVGERSLYTNWHHFLCLT